MYLLYNFSWNKSKTRRSVHSESKTEVPKESLPSTPPKNGPLKIEKTLSNLSWDQSNLTSECFQNMTATRWFRQKKKWKKWKKRLASAYLRRRDFWCTSVRTTRHRRRKCFNNSIVWCTPLPLTSPSTGHVFVVVVVAFVRVFVQVSEAGSIACGRCDF